MKLLMVLTVKTVLFILSVMMAIGTKVLRKLSGRLPEILLILKTVTGGLEIPI